MENGLNYNFKTKLEKIEDSNDRLKIIFKTISSEPLVFKTNNKFIMITENYDIYEVTLQLFPVITIIYAIKNAGTDYNEVPLRENVVDVDALGFNDYDEFRQFIIKYPAYVRYIQFMYDAFFNARPWLFLLYTSRISCKHDIKTDQNKIEIVVEKIRIETIFKRYEINEKITFRLLRNQGDSVLLLIENAPIVEFGSSMNYSNFSKILEERPEAILNTLIMLTITLVD